MVSRGTDRSQSTPPNGWCPPITEGQLESRYLIHEHARRIDDTETDGDGPPVETVLDVAGEMELSAPDRTDEGVMLAGRDRSGVVTKWFRWQFEHQSEGCWEVTQRTYLGRRWRYLLVSLYGILTLPSFGTGLLWLDRIPLHVPFAKEAAGVLLVLSFLVMVFIGVLLLLVASSLRLPLQYAAAGYEVRRQSRLLVGEGAYTSGVLFLLMLLPPVHYTLSPAVWVGSSALLVATGLALALIVGCIHLGVGVGVARGGHFLWVRRSLDAVRWTSPGRGTYITRLYLGLLLVTAPGPILVALRSFVLPRVVTVVPTWALRPFLFPFFHALVATTTVAGLVVAYRLSKEDSAVPRWKRDLDIGSLHAPRQRGLAVLSVVLFQAGALSTVAIVWEVVALRVLALPSLGSVFLASTTDAVLAAVACGPFGYVLGGLLVQVLGNLAHLVRYGRILDIDEEGSQARRLAARRPEVTASVDPPVVLVPTDRRVGRAVRLPRREAIVVSTAVERVLDDDQLAAVLAHEEAHLQHSDAVIRLLGPFLGAALGLSQAVVFALFDFRRREYRADRYACRQTSPTAVRSAIQTLTDRTSTGVDTNTDATADAEEGADHGEPSTQRASPAQGVDQDELVPQEVLDEIEIPEYTPSFASVPGGVGGAFRPMFSGFSVVAHPLPDERLAAVDPAASTPPDAREITPRDDQPSSKEEHS